MTFRNLLKLLRLYTVRSCIRAARSKSAVQDFLLIAASVFFYLTALTQNVASNRVKYLAILGFPSGLFLLLSGIFVLLYISNRRNMTIGDHSAAADGLRILTLISSALLVLLSAATFIYALISGGQETGREIFCAVAELLSAAAVFAINRIETAMPYEDVPNETPSPENANIIR